MFSNVPISTFAGIVILNALYSTVMSAVFLACGSGCSCNSVGIVTSTNFALLLGVLTSDFVLRIHPANVDFDIPLVPHHSDRDRLLAS